MKMNPQRESLEGRLERESGVIDENARVTIDRLPGMLGHIGFLCRAGVIKRNETLTLVVGARKTIFKVDQDPETAPDRGDAEMIRGKVLSDGPRPGDRRI